MSPTKFFFLQPFIILHPASRIVGKQLPEEPKARSASKPKPLHLMEMLDNSINWIEIPVTDFDRAKKFYSTIYDYEMPETFVRDVRMGFLLYEQKEHRVGGAICQGQLYKPSSTGVIPYLNGGGDLRHRTRSRREGGRKNPSAKNLHRRRTWLRSLHHRHRRQQDCAAFEEVDSPAPHAGLHADAGCPMQDDHAVEGLEIVGLNQQVM